MGRREDKVAQTRSRLLSIADQLIASHGYEDVSVDQIVAQCGVAKGTFYNYYESKADLITSLSQLHFRPLTDNTDRFINGSPVEAVGGYVTEFMQIVVHAQIGLARQWVRYIATSNGNQSKWKNDVSNLVSFLEKLIAVGYLKKETPVQEISELLMTHIYGLVLTWTIVGENFNPVVQIGKSNHSFLPALLEPYRE